MTEEQKLQAWRDCLEKALDAACFLYRMREFNYELVRVKFKQEAK